MPEASHWQLASHATILIVSAINQHPWLAHHSPCLDWPHTCWGRLHEAGEAREPTGIKKLPWKSLELYAESWNNFYVSDMHYSKNQSLSFDYEKHPQRLPHYVLDSHVQHLVTETPS